MSIDTIKELISRAEREIDSDNSEHRDDIFQQIATKLHDCTSRLEEPPPRRAAATLKKSALKLWDVSIVLGQNGAKSETVVKLRHALCDMYHLALCDSDQVTEESLLIAINVFSRTAQMYLNEMSQLAAADELFRWGMEKYDLVVGKYGGLQDKGGDPERHQIFFNLFLWRAELLLLQKNMPLFYDMISRSRQCVKFVQEERATLSAFLYTSAVAAVKREDFSDAIKCLTASYEIYSTDALHDPAQQARTLQLLCHAYTKTGDLENALRTISKANEEVENGVGLFLYASVLLQQTVPEEDVRAVIEKCYGSNDCDLELVLQLASEAQKYKYSAISTEIYDALEEKYVGDIKKLSTVRIHRIESLMECNESAALDVFDNLDVTDVNLEQESAKSFYALAWNKSLSLIDAKKYTDAILWLQHALKMSRVAKSPTVDVHLVIANAFLKSNELSRALEHIDEAKVLDRKNRKIALLEFELALLQKNTSFAIECITSMKNNSGNASNDVLQAMLLSCARAGHFNEQKEVASLALESVVNMFPDVGDSFTGKFGDLLYTLVDMLRVDITSNANKKAELAVDGGGGSGSSSSSQQIDGSQQQKMEVDAEKRSKKRSREDRKHEEEEEEQVNETQLLRLLAALKKGVEVIKAKGAEFAVGNSDALLDWFSITAYNLARLTVSLNKKKQAVDFFECSYFFAEQLQKMSKESAIGEVEREMERTSLLQKALLHLRQCKAEVEIELKNGTTPTQRLKTSFLTVQQILSLYYIKALLYLSHVDLPKSLEELKTSTFVTPQLLEEIAVAAQVAERQDIVHKALEWALEAVMSARESNYSQALSLLRRLVQTSVDGREATFRFYKTAQSLLQGSAQQEVDDKEVRWFTTTAWNCGVFFARLHKAEAAESWMSLSLSLLQFIKGEKSSLDTAMKSGYNQLLGTLSQSKAKGVNAVLLEN